MPNYYSFTAFMRKGLANSIRNIADLSAGASGNSAVLARPNIEATVYVKFDDLAPEGVRKSLDVYSPANVAGIDKRAIIRTDPEHYCTNFEPNYLACIEFFEEDFPWRFTPTSINTQQSQNERLTPWLALVVLEEGEFDAANITADTTDVKQLPFFKLKSTASPAKIFVPFAELHHWAHVHVNADVSTNTTTTLKQQVDEEGDNCYARIVCPRRLKADTNYHAFLVPSFETGRLAGLGDFATAESTSVNKCSWDAGQTDFPYYHRWYFATGSMGDFEYLVRQLKPKPADERIGYRPLAVDGIADPLQLPGCLRVPLGTLPQATRTKIENYEKWAGASPHAWQLQTAASIDVLTGSNADPVVTRPLYGRWHAKVEARLYNGSGANATLNPAVRKWITDLNLDPRYRAIAALGVESIQKNQEDLMDAAWDQVDEIREANEKIRLAQLSIQVNKRFEKVVLNRFTDEQLIGFTIPLHKNVNAYAGRPQTVYNAVGKSPVPNSADSNLFRKVTRNTSRVALLANNRTHWFAANNRMLDAMNRNALSILRDKPTPSGFLSDVKFKEVVNRFVITQPVFTTASIADRNKLVNLVNDAMVYNNKFIDTLGQPSTKFSYRSTNVVFTKPVAMPGRIQPGSNIQPGIAVPPRTSPVRPRFNEPVISRPVTNAVTDRDLIGEIGIQLPEKNVFLHALENTALVLQTQTQIRVEEVVPLNIANIKTNIVNKLQPSPLFLQWYSHLYPQVFTGVEIEEWFEPVMKYPVFNTPVYNMLKERSTEYFLPNINLIEPNSVTLLETNQRFIESYMAGLNYEMARELLWRGYPTDQRGSYFRLFWDSVQNRYDINEMHTWNKALGFNNEERTDNYLVLVVRGDLLKKFPRTVIGAQKASWSDNNVNKSRVVNEAAPFILPIFEAYIQPDIFFIGFNLKEEDLIGASPATSVSQDPGYFFILKERPGEPRFGLDESSSTQAITQWNQLSWGKVNTDANDVLKMSSTPQPITFNKTGDDAQANFPAANSAQLAYILYQQPALIAIHASQLLKH